MTGSVRDLSERSRDIFKSIVETYLETGEPVGSRTLARATPLQLSPASIRNVMADLEDMGLLAAPHASAGRVPTHMGLRLFVDGLLEVGDVSQSERETLEAQIAGQDRSLEDLLAQATSALSGLSHCAGLVVAPRQNANVKHIEFVPVSSEEALVVLVTENGVLENRMIKTPAGLTPAALEQAMNFLNTTMRGRTLEQARLEIEREMERNRTELGELTQRLIEAGIATWDDSGSKGAAADNWADRRLIVRGQANLLDEIEAAADLDRIRHLFADLENQRDLVHLLEITKDADGVRIFIGSESKIFSLSGSSLIAAPYFDKNRKIIGAIGVIGPTRLNYARIIPIVDYTARTVSELLARHR